jgi:hypothetical protein
MHIVIKVEDEDERGLTGPAESLARELRERFPMSEVSRIDVEYSPLTTIRF